MTTVQYWLAAGSGEMLGKIMHFRLYRSAISDPFSIAFNKYFDFKFNANVYRYYPIQISNSISFHYDLKDPSGVVSVYWMEVST